MRHSKLAALVLAGLILGSAPAFAEGEEELDEVSAQVKAQMEKIIRLMRENEEALIKISTGGKDEPRRVDVDVPVPPSASGSGGGGREGGSQSDGSPQGQSVEDALDELIRGQRQRGKQIPGELEELVRMVPQ